MRLVRTGNIALAMNPETFHVSPQYHVVFDNEFTMADYIEQNVELRPANSEMQPIVLRNDDVRILGVVCAVIRRYENKQL